MRIRLRHFCLMMNTSLFKLSSVDFQSVFPPVFYYQFYFSLYTMQFVRGFEILSGMKPKINIWAKTQRLMNLMPMRQLEMDKRGKPLGTEIHSEVQSLAFSDSPTGEMHTSFLCLFSLPQDAPYVSDLGARQTTSETCTVFIKNSRLTGFRALGATSGNLSITAPWVL